jgi:hypothetical protein
MKQRSAFLYTVVLAVGATVLCSQSATTSGTLAVVEQLSAHAEKLCVMIYSTGAKSVEIVQAMLVRVSQLVRSKLIRIDLG